MTKNKIFKTVALLLFLIIAATVFIACGTSGAKLPGASQNTNHIVHNNGSSAVQYGNYVYSINGYDGYSDTDGNSNKDVVKGAIIRSELYNNGLIGEDFAIDSQKNDYNNPNSEKYNPELKYSSSDFILNPDLVDTDYDDVEDDLEVLTYRVANKRVGTTGYRDGGIFVFGDYLYFATPSNERDNTGAMETNKTELYVANLDGTGLKRIYKTNSTADSSPYSFYEKDGTVLAVILDGTNLVSIQTNATKISKPKIIAEKVDAAVLPHNDTWQKGISTNNVEDYLYFTRAVDEHDIETSGNVLEMIKPDGSSRKELVADGTTTTLSSVNDGLLFYTKTSLLDFVNYCYSDLAVQRGLEENNVEGVVTGEYQAGDYTRMYGYRTNKNSNEVFVLAINDSFVDLYQTGTTKYKQLFSGKADVFDVYNGLVYFVNEDGYIATVSTNFNGVQTANVVSSKVVNNSGIRPTIMKVTENPIYASDNTIVGYNNVNAYLVFDAKVDDWADNYIFFKKIVASGDTEEILVAQIIDSDKKSDDTDDTDDGDDSGDGSTDS